MHVFHASVTRRLPFRSSALESLLWVFPAVLAGYLAARLGGALALQIPQTVWPFWPGCAVLVSMLVLLPRRIWPVLVCAGLAGFAVYDAQAGVPFRSIALLILSDLAEVLVVAWGITRFLGATPRLNSLRNFATYSVFGLILAPLIAASIGSLALAGDDWINWRISAVSEALAFLTIAPAILGWVSNARGPARYSLAGYVEMAILLALLVPLCYLSFVVVQRAYQPILLYSLLPFLLWSALRFGAAGAGTVGSLIAFVSVWGAVHGGGPFAQASAMDNVLSLQVFLLFAATPFMALALLVEEHRDAQRALGKSEEKFAKAFHASPMALALTDVEDGRYIDVNATFERMSGYSRQDALGRTAFELGIWVDPNQRAEVMQILRREGHGATIEALLRTKSGVSLTCLVSAELIEIDGKIRTLFVVADISDRKRAEEALALANDRLHTAMEASRTVAWDWDVKTGCDQWFGDLQTMFGMSGDRYSGRVEDFRQRVHPEDRDSVWTAVQRAMTEHQPYAAEFRVVRSDGAVRWVSAKGRFHYADGGSAERMLGMAVDVTERKLAEESLRESEGRESARAKELQAVLDTVPVGIFIAKDAACSDIRTNRAGYELLRAQQGLNVSKSAVRDDLPGLTILRNGQEIAPDQLPIQVAAATGRPVVGVALTLRFSDGAEREVVTNAYPLLAEDGTSRGAVAAIVDVTERKRAEQALRESDERFHFAAQAGRMFAYEWDLQTDLITRSAECAEILGISGDVAHTTGAEVAKSIHPEDLERLSVVLAALTPANPIYCSSLRVLRPDGKTIWLERTGRAFFDAQGRPVRVIGMAVDITVRRQAEIALRESEERLRMAVRAGRMYAYEWDVASDVIVRSPECLDLLGRGAPVRTTRREMMAHVHPDDVGLCSVQGVTPDNPSARTRYRVLRDDGSWVWLEKTARGFFDESGNLTRMVGMIVDVSERKQAEEALASVSRRLIEAHEEERTWIARELHDDVNQRLALLAIEVEQLMQSPSGQHEFRRSLREIWARVTELTNDIQAISHRFHSSKLEYLGIVAAAAGFCRELMEQKKVEIDFRHSGVPENVPGEVGLSLFRVLQEALHNAVKSSGVRQFSVELLGSPEEILLTVSDAGRGFDPEAAMKSHGLGLVSMRERLHLVNGEFRVESQPDRGTRVYARVPLLPKRSLAATGA